MSLIYIGGAKGGVGKSLVSMLVLDIIREENPVLVETDQSNPDVYKAYENSVESITANMDTDAGWAKALNEIDARRGRPIVINSAARNSMGISKFGDTFNALGVDMTLLWAVNPQKDSLLLLDAFMKAVEPARSYVVKNGFFGADEDFDLYNGSKIRKTMTGDCYLPELLSTAANVVYSQRKPLHELAEILPVGDRLLFEGWRRKAHKALKPILEG